VSSRVVPLGSASRFEVAHGVGYFGKRIGLAHDRSNLPGLDELAQRLEVGLTVLGDERRQPLSIERGDRVLAMGEMAYW
jgi:hypothetical protein